MEIIYLETLLMPNREILFLGKSIGFVNDENRKYVHPELNLSSDELALIHVELIAALDNYTSEANQETSERLQNIIDKVGKAFGKLPEQE